MANNYFWRGSNGNYANAANWLPSIIPTAADKAIFDTGQGIISGNGAALDITTQPATGPWTFTGAIAATTAHLSNTTFASGSSLTLQSNGTGGSGALTIANAVTFDHATLSGNGASLAFGSASAPSTLALTTGSTATLGTANIGSSASASSTTVTLSGLGTKLAIVSGTTSTGQLYIGGPGSTGSLNLSSSAATTVDQDANLGFFSNSTGNLSVSTGASFAVKGIIRVGAAGSTNAAGNITVNGAGTVTTSASTTQYDILGDAAGSNANLSVDGTGSSWSSGNQFIVGNSGTGTATITNNATLSAVGRIAVGQLAGSNGTLSILSGATATTAADIFVGNTAGATGSLTIGAGSTLRSTRAATSTARTLYIGANGPFGTTAAAKGTVTVTGAGALLDLGANAASVDGQGTLNVLAGGTALFGASDPSLITALNVGRYSGDATTTIDGTNSKVQARNVTVGRVGVGHIVIGNGGALNLNGSDVNNDGLAVGLGGTTGLPTGFGGSGDVIVNAGGAINLGGGGISIANGKQAKGTLTINAGGAVRSTAAVNTVGSTLLIASNSSADAGTLGIVNVLGAGATLDIGANGIALGQTGTATLTVAGGGTVKSASADSRALSALSSGRNAGSSATLKVTGTGSSVTAAGYTYFGRAGTANVTIDQGGTFTGGQAASGDGTGVNAVQGVAIGVGSTTLDYLGNTNTVYAGGTGTAAVATGGTLHSLGDLIVGQRGSTGNLTIDGATSIALADRLVGIGTGTDRAGAVGTVTVQNGGTLRGTGAVNGSAAIYLANDAGSTGTLIVTGVGSLADAGTTRIVVGGVGTGALAISNGGHATASSSGYTDTESAFSVGRSVGGVGTTTIDGAGSQLVVAGQAAIAGGNSGTGLAAGGIATLSATVGGLFKATSLALFKGGTLSVDAASTVAIGTGSGTAGRITVDAAGSVVTQGGTINGAIADQGSLINAGGALTINGNVSGTGAIGVGAGLLTVNGTIGAEAVTFSAPGATLRSKGLTGSGSVTGFQLGDSVDLAGSTTATLTTSGGVTSLHPGTGSLTLAPAAAGTAYKLYGDGQGGQQVLLDAAPTVGGVAYSDVTAGTSGTSTATTYTGPVDYLQQQYLWANDHAVAITQSAPNTFLKGGAAGDALLVTGGNNVIDGGGGSNFLIGADGADGGFDTFFVDSRGGVETWSTIVNFHQGDRATIFGFHPGLSTRPYTASDGAVGYTGLTIHSEINGPGTGILGSITFAGLTQATADAHFSITEDTLLKGTPGAIDYLLIQWNR